MSTGSAGTAGTAGSAGRGKISRLSRQKSLMVVESNPLESGTAGTGLIPGFKVENLNHATIITPDELKILLKKMESFTDNEEMLQYLEGAKSPYLFSSDQLSTMIDVTTSVKTKIAIISSVGPRLIDPKSKITYFTGLFRFADEKSAVEEVLKARAQVLTTVIFTRRDGIRSFGGLGGRSPLAGRNPLFGAGRGLGAGTKSANWRPVQKPNDYTLDRSRNTFKIPSEDSVENQTPTVFGFDAVLNALDDPGKIHKQGSNSLETIKESSRHHIDEEDEGEEDDYFEDEENNHQFSHEFSRSEGENSLDPHGSTSFGEGEDENEDEDEHEKAR